LLAGGETDLALPLTEREPGRPVTRATHAAGPNLRSKKDEEVADPLNPFNTKAAEWGVNPGNAVAANPSANNRSIPVAAFDPAAATWLKIGFHHTFVRWLDRSDHATSTTSHDAEAEAQSTA
jgi:hypothetical protein